jgi:hypothetical protein
VAPRKRAHAQASNRRSSLDGSRADAHFTGICPIVKRIWTPAWTLFSGGLCFLILAALRPAKGKWTFPLVVIGANSIAAYLIAHLWDGFFDHSLKTHFGPVFSDLFIRGVAIWCCIGWCFIGCTANGSS